MEEETIQATLPQLAFNLKNAAKVMGICYESLRKEIRRRKIFPTETFNTLTLDEIQRYLKEETELGRRLAFKSLKA